MTKKKPAKKAAKKRQPRKLKRKKRAPEDVAIEKLRAETAPPTRNGKATSLAALVTLEPDEPRIRSATVDRLKLIRHQAMLDYVTDPDCRSSKFHYERHDRHYARYASYDAFREWCTAEAWIARRKQFWDKLSLRILDEEQDRLLKEQREEADQLRFVRRHLIEHLMPVTDKATGEVLRYPELDKHGDIHPLAGKPVFPYPITSYDKAIKAFLEVDERLMLKRGEVTKRVENAAQPAGDGAALPPGTSPLDPVTQSVRFTPEQLRAMSRSIVVEHQPELAVPLAIDADEEPDHDGDESI